MVALGIDGCKSGWYVAAFANNNFCADIYSNITNVIGHFKSVDIILIDIPLGLGDKSIERDLDKLARRELKPNRYASVFTPPVRESLESTNYDRAKSANLAVTGKMISLQTWNISRKIKELDKFLIESPEWRSKIHESHPEICFKYLNGSKALSTSKLAAGNIGIDERLEVMSKYDADVVDYFTFCRNNHPRNRVKNDDIIDAICLAITAKMGWKHGFSKLYGTNKTDIKGIEMSMYHYNPMNN